MGKKHARKKYENEIKREGLFVNVMKRERGFITNLINVAK